MKSNPALKSLDELIAEEQRMATFINPKSAIEFAWRRYCIENGYKPLPVNVKYQRAEAAFFNGAIATLNVMFPGELASAKVPPEWLLSLHGGTPVDKGE